MPFTPTPTAARPNRGQAGFRFLGLLIVVLLPGLTGCPMQPVDTPDTDAGRTEPGVKNNTLATATAIDLGAEDRIEFTGTIGDADDTDVYDLGVLSPGDALFVDVQKTSGTLDPVAAIFDESERVHAFNDDREPDSSNLNPQIDFVIRGVEGHYFLGITPFPGSGSSGDYRVIVNVERGVGIPEAEGQTVYLDWVGGANIRIENVGVFDIAPFDASIVGLTSAQTEALKDRIQEIVADRYADYQFTLLNSDDHALPASGATIIYFGGENRSAFAIAEQIDSFNADKSDKAIIFVSSYDGAFSVRRPTVEQMATAIGNTVAHEVGHLLGLVHTADCASLMDTACGNDSILVGQAFKVAALDDSVFPFGFQDADEILSWVLGLVGL